MSTQIGYEDVSRAAEQLLAEGRPVGPTKVREMIGRGSFTTVQKYLTEWEGVQAQKKLKTEEEKRTGPPEELSIELQKIIAAYWPHALARAREDMAPEFQALVAKLGDAIARNKEATIEIGNLENKLEAALVKAAKMDEAEKRASEANSKIIAIQVELSRLEKIEARFESQKELIQSLQEQAASAKSLLEQNAALNKKAEVLNSELSQLRSKLDAALAKAAKTEEAERRVVEANQGIATLQKEVSRLEKIEARFETQIENLHEQNSALAKKTDSLSSALADERSKTAKLEAKLEAGGKK